MWVRVVSGHVVQVHRRRPGTEQAVCGAAMRVPNLTEIAGCVTCRRCQAIQAAVRQVTAAVLRDAQDAPGEAAAAGRPEHRQTGRDGRTHSPAASELPFPAAARVEWETHCPCGLTMAACRRLAECPE